MLHCIVLKVKSICLAFFILEYSCIREQFDNHKSKSIKMWTFNLILEYPHPIVLSVNKLICLTYK